jgi:transcriptional regulator with XRE-family HTH domain
MTRAVNFYSEVREGLGRAARRKVEEREIRVGAVVRRLREETHLSAAELCRRSGAIDPRTLSAVEKGRIRNPSVETLQAIAKGLGCLVRDLFTEAELGQGESFVVGSQKGVFKIEFPRLGIKVVSATPVVGDFFCGKLILEPLRGVEGELPWGSHPLFFEVVMGKIEFEIEGRKMVLREGENLFLRGGLHHAIRNPLNRESAVWVVTAPSLFRGGGG